MKTEYKSDLRFEWEDEDYGFHKCILYDGKNKIDNICFWDYTSEFHQRDDRENGYTRPYSFEVSWCDGWSMSHGFDLDKEYNHHWDEKYLPDRHIAKGGYQGNCTHTVDDIKNWCEEWLAQQYIKHYEHIINELEKDRQRAEWFESQGYGNRNLNEEDERYMDDNYG
jgi:hypothetical protein